MNVTGMTFTDTMALFKIPYSW